MVAVVGRWQAEGVAAVIWDHAPNHTAQVVQGIGLPLIGCLPTRLSRTWRRGVIQELRRAVEGHVAGELERTIAAVEAALRAGGRPGGGPPARELAHRRPRYPTRMIL